MKSLKSLFSLRLALACAAFTFSLAVCAQAQTFSYFTNFSARDEGAASVMQATDGNFYMGGHPGAYGQGAILRVTPSGEFNVLYSFCSQRGLPRRDLSLYSHSRKRWELLRNDGSRRQPFRGRNGIQDDP